MKIPILDIRKQILPIRKEIDSAIRRVIDNCNFILGKEVEDFEQAIKIYTGAKYALGVSNGTDALRLALLSLGIREGDRVICPAFTFYATAGAIASIGAIPVFTDIDPETYNLSLCSLEETLKSRRSAKAKAIIPVHLFGQCADMPGIRKLARKFNLKVIEDVAQAFGASFQGKKSGTLGDCGAISFFPGKNLGAFGDAGLILTNKKSIADKILILRNQGTPGNYRHQVLGYNNRLDAIQAAVLKVKLKYLDRWNKKREENAAYFNRRMRDLDILLPKVIPESTHIFHQYVIRVDKQRDKLAQYLKEKGIDCRIYYPTPLHLQSCFKYLNYKRGDFPQAEQASREVLAIPVYPELFRRELDYIVDSIRGFLKNG